MTVTGFKGIYVNGDIANIDAHGNNVAFLCNKCGNPVLAIAREHQRGSSINKPATCLGCGEDYIIAAKEKTKLVTIYNASEL